MADGTNENQFTALEDGTYQSSVKDGSLTIVTSYDEDFEITPKNYSLYLDPNQRDKEIKITWVRLGY